MRLWSLSWLALATACAGGCKGGPPSKHGESLVVSGTPAKQGDPNASGQKPAFAGQTRAPAPSKLSMVKLETITSELDKPWGVEALKDGRFVVTEKAGQLRVVTKEGAVLEPIAGVPEVDSGGQGGLLDVAIDERNSELTLCLTFSEPRDGGKNGTTAVCGTASGSENLTLSALKPSFRQEPAWDSSLHFGSRLVFAADDLVYITTGERSLPQSRVFAQDTKAALGKVIRLKRDGSAPSDNPFAAEGG